MSAPRRENWPHPGSLDRLWTETDLKPCTVRPFGLKGDLESQSQNGNPIETRIIQ
jgi:hypothetical protein